MTNYKPARRQAQQAAKRSHNGMYRGKGFLIRPDGSFISTANSAGLTHRLLCSSLINKDVERKSELLYCAKHVFRQELAQLP